MPATSTSTSHQLSQKQSRTSARHSTLAIPEINQTPTKNKTDAPWGDALSDSPLSARRQRLLSRRDQVGPTPQKTGRVLGIFDSFIDVESTPPRSTQRGQIEQGTPSKTKKDRVSASPSPRLKEDDASPFLTPRKRKLGEMKITPRSREGRGNVFATPSALREWKPPVVDGELASPQVRRPPPMPKRGLSSMLKELREMEDHALDDEEEAMREMEAEAAGQSPVKKPKKTTPIFDQPELPPLPPGAFIEETQVHGHDEEGERVWKKKGLKRQHKRIISGFSVVSHWIYLLIVTQCGPWWSNRHQGRTPRTPMSSLFPPKLKTTAKRKLPLQMNIRTPLVSTARMMMNMLLSRQSDPKVRLLSRTRKVLWRKAKRLSNGLRARFRPTQPHI
jgi:DNA replication regulator SLD2